ncbi:MAG: hypothetical protein WEA29_04065 [Acidimicrobiia bacterium]
MYSGTASNAKGLSEWFIDAEIAAMEEGRYAKTQSRSIVASMNGYVRVAD